MADAQDTTITAPVTPAAVIADAPITRIPLILRGTAPATSTEVAATVTAPVAEAAKPEVKAETPTPPSTESILGDTAAKEVKADDKKQAKPEG